MDILANYNTIINKNCRSGIQNCRSRFWGAGEIELEQQQCYTIPYTRKVAKKR